MGSVLLPLPVVVRARTAPLARQRLLGSLEDAVALVGDEVAVVAGGVLGCGELDGSGAIAWSGAVVVGGSSGLVVWMRDVVEAALVRVTHWPGGWTLPLSLAATRVSVALERLLCPGVPDSFVFLRVHDLVVVMLGLLAQETALTEDLVLQHPEATVVKQ